MFWALGYALIWAPFFLGIPLFSMTKGGCTLIGTSFSAAGGANLFDYCAPKGARAFIGGNKKFLFLKVTVVFSKWKVMPFQGVST